MILFGKSKGPDRTARMRRMIWPFAVRMYPETIVSYGAAQSSNNRLSNKLIEVNKYPILKLKSIETLDN